MSESYADIVITQANGEVFTNTARGDMTVYTESDTQSIHIGTRLNSNAALKITSSNIGVSAPIVPTAHEQYDLGAPSNAFRDLYLSGTTLYLGGVKMSKNASNNIEVRDADNSLRTIVVEQLQIGEGSNSVLLTTGETGGLNFMSSNGASTGIPASSITSGIVDSARLPAATSNAPGIVQLIDTSNSTDTSRATTAAALKAVADARLPLTGGTLTGPLNATDIEFTGQLTRNGLPFQSGTQGLSNNSSNLFVIGGSNFGIHTATPQRPLHVAGPALIDGDIEFTGSLLQNGVPFVSGGGSGSVGGFSNNGSNVFTLPGFNLGVGTSNTLAKLHVKGDTMIEGDIKLTQRVNLRGVSLFKRTSNGQPQSITTEITHPAIQSTQTYLGLALSNQQSSFNFINAASNTVVTINSNGTINFTGQLTQNGQPFQSGTPGLSNNSSNIFVITGSNLGIRTATPQAPLHVVGNAQVDGNIAFTGSLLRNGVPFQSGTPGLSNNSSNLFVISGSNFGIGTSIPSNLLHVAGSSRFDGDITLQNYVNLRGVKVQKRAASIPQNLTTVVSNLPFISSNATALDLTLAGLQQNVRVLNNSSTPVITLSNSGVINATSNITINNQPVALSNHVHDASHITTGILPVARGGTGTASNTGTGNLVLNSNPTFAGITSASGQVLGTSNDTSNVPGYSWVGDVNTGMYHPAEDAIGFACGGSNVMTLSTARVMIPRFHSPGSIVQVSYYELGIMRSLTTEWAAIAGMSNVITPKYSNSRLLVQISLQSRNEGNTSYFSIYRDGVVETFPGTATSSATFRATTTVDTILTFSSSFLANSTNPTTFALWGVRSAGAPNTFLGTINDSGKSSITIQEIAQ